MNEMSSNDIEQEIRRLVNELAEELAGKYNLRYRLPAPVAFASTDDPLWDKIKEIHPWLSHPKELLPNARSVITYAIPLSWEAILSNVGGFDPSREWLRDYAYANRVIGKISERVAGWLGEKGFKSIGLKATHDFDQKTLKSSWSHRHAGYVAGLGTFGLNRLLITEKGVAVRLGSILTEAKLRPTPRPNYEYCLAKRGRKCSKCLENCPIDALTNWEEKKDLCWHKQLLTSIEHKDLAEAFSYSVDACGKCAVGVPCTVEVPP